MRINTLQYQHFPEILKFQKTELLRRWLYVLAPELKLDRADLTSIMSNLT